MIDTGAEVSVLQAKPEDKLGTPMLRELVAANGSRIKCFGQRKLQFQIGKRKYELTFLLAAVKRALL